MINELTFGVTLVLHLVALAGVILGLMYAYDARRSTEFVSALRVTLIGLGALVVVGAVLNLNYWVRTLKGERVPDE